MDNPFHLFEVVSAYLVAGIGIAGMVFLGTWVWMGLIDRIARIFKFHVLLKDFLWEHWWNKK